MVCGCDSHVRRAGQDAPSQALLQCTTTREGASYGLGCWQSTKTSVEATKLCPDLDWSPACQTKQAQHVADHRCCPLLICSLIPSQIQFTSWVSTEQDTEGGAGPGRWRRSLGERGGPGLGLDRGVGPLGDGLLPAPSHLSRARTTPAPGEGWKAGFLPWRAQSGHCEGCGGPGTCSAWCGKRGQP